MKKRSLEAGGCYSRWSLDKGFPVKTYVFFASPVKDAIVTVTFPLIEISEKLFQVGVIRRFVEIQATHVPQINTHLLCKRERENIRRHEDIGVELYNETGKGIFRYTEFHGSEPIIKGLNFTHTATYT